MGIFKVGQLLFFTVDEVAYASMIAYGTFRCMEGASQGCASYFDESPNKTKMATYSSSFEPICSSH